MIRAILSQGLIVRSLFRPLLIRTSLPRGRVLLLSALTYILAPPSPLSLADGGAPTFSSAHFLDLDFAFSPDYEKELKSKLGGKRGPMADLDGLIPLEAVAIIGELSERYRKEGYARYREEIKRKRHELWLAGDRAAYDEYANTVSYAKYEYRK